jgi:serine/threonine protein kinase
LKVTPGTRLADRYVVTGEIGAGGMGIVVRARDEKLGRTVAIKVLPPDAVGDDSARRRLVREARAAASLDHRGIVHVYDVGETDDGGTFFIMELVRGKSLGTHLREGTLNRGQRLVVMIEVARALAYAHAQGFAHRDIKPDNVMIREDGSPVILDFGLAKAYQAELASTMEALSVTAKGGFVGTPAYVSPEQARGETVDPSTDQFALAVATFEAMSGKLPWEGTTPIEVISEILKGTPKSLREIQAALPAELERVLEKALSKKKGDRYASIDDFADALAACLPELGVTSGPVSARSTPQTSATLSGPIVGSNPASISATKVSSPEALVSATKVSATQAPSRKKWALAAVTLAAITGGFFLVSKLVGKAPAASSKPAFAYATNEQWVLACPQLEAQDTEVKAIGFLGAAASALVCSRAQIILGGRSARTLSPAELLDLPREPRDGFPENPYEMAGARDKAIAAAKQKADAWIDGKVESGSDIHLTLVVRDKKGDELARAESRQLVLMDAVRDAMAQLRTAGAIPDAKDATLRERILPNVSIDAALAVHDMTVSDLIEDKDGVRASCDGLAKRTDLGAIDSLVRTICARANGTPLPPEPPPPAGDASPIALATQASVLRFYGAGTEEKRAMHRAHASRLEDAAVKETDADIRAVLAAAAAEIHYHALSDPAKANALSRSSIQASPKEVDVRGTAWHRIAFSSVDTSMPVLAGEAAWTPWHPFAKSNMLRDATGDTYRSAAILSRRGYWALAYGEQLLRMGKLETARGVAVQTNSNYLLFLVTAGDGKPGEALAKIAAYVDRTQPTSQNALEAIQVVTLGVDIAEVLGKPMGFADTYLQRFVDPDKPGISKGVVPFFSLAGICVRLPNKSGRDCSRRLRSLFAGGHFGAAFPSSSETVDGVEKYVAGDVAGAAKAWRSIARSGTTADAWGYPFVDAFEKNGDVDIATRMDAKAVEQNIKTPNADLAWVREATRAEKRGDFARAKSLAQAYLDRWETADERSKAWPDMKKLLSRVAK